MRETLYLEFKGDFSDGFEKNFNKNLLCSDNCVGRIVGNVFFVRIRRYGCVMNPNPFELRGRVTDNAIIEYYFQKRLIPQFVCISITVLMFLLGLFFLYSFIGSTDTYQQRIACLGCGIALGIILVIWIPQIVFATYEKKQLLEMLQKLAECK